MIEFVNAKINIGLQVVNRRPDGYHDLQTLFFPVGLYSGTPADPGAFCDLLEVTPDPPSSSGASFSLSLSGRQVECPPEKNLVWRAAVLYLSEAVRDRDFTFGIRLEKHLPDGAGMGGGSADAAFTLRMLRDLDAARTGASPEEILSDRKMRGMALALGADCPFFLYNRAAYADGVGERLTPVEISLDGYWLLVVKPSVSISTREAFAGITPHPAAFDLRRLPEVPLDDWKDCVHNDFEDSLFPAHPEFGEIKRRLYAAGAIYASLTGSGSCLYAIYPSQGAAADARALFPASPTITATYLLRL